MKRQNCLLVLAWVLLTWAGATDLHAGESVFDQLGLDTHGYAETCAAAYVCRTTRKNPTLGLEAARSWNSPNPRTGRSQIQGRCLGRRRVEQGEYDTRELWAFARPRWTCRREDRPSDPDMGHRRPCLLNDLFPKELAVVLHRPRRRIPQGPSDAAKISLFTEICDMDLVYSRAFDRNRFITGELYLPLERGARHGPGRHAGRRTPDGWFEDDEIAPPLSRTVSGYELAAYGYDGFWKTRTPEPTTVRRPFPGCAPWARAFAGKWARASAMAEFAWYHSWTTRTVVDADIPNSELRYLVGYSGKSSRTARHPAILCRADAGLRGLPRFFVRRLRAR
jgi:hypothetical protein